MEKKMLIAGGGYADIPMILAARRLGFYVITSGNRPDELGHKHSDLYIPADFSDKDAILAIAKEQSVSAICSSCNDFSALSCAYVAEKLALVGHDPFETALNIHHKDRYREFARKHGIPTPMAMSFSSKSDALCCIDKFALPVIVKPVDLTGGKGVSTVEQPQQYKLALEKAFNISRQGRIVVEEYVAGTKHGLSILIVRGKAVFWMADDEYYYLNPFLVSGASTPSSAQPGAIQDVVNQSEKIAEILSLCDGIFHVQFISNAQRTVIIEICRRPPGDLYVDLVKHATGLDYPEYLVKFAAGYDCSDIKQRESDGYFLRHCIMGDKPGRVKEIQYSSDVKEYIIDQMLWWRPGDLVRDVLTHKHGIVFLKFNSRKEMVEHSSQMQSLIKVIVEE